MQASFSNTAIAVESLPRLTENEFVAVERAYLWLRLLSVIGFSVFLLTAVVIAPNAGVDLSGLQVSLALAAIVVLTVLVAILTWLEVGRRGYLVREHDYSYRSGLLRQSVVTIPFSRVQNVAVDRGPLVRAFGLANLRLFSAGGGLTTMGLSTGDAQHLKSFVVERARVIADEEQDARR